VHGQARRSLKLPPSRRTANAATGTAAAC
jgi:hypothetical protein